MVIAAKVNLRGGCCSCNQIIFIVAFALESLWLLACGFATFIQEIFYQFEDVSPWCAVSKMKMLFAFMLIRSDILCRAHENLLRNWGACLSFLESESASCSDRSFFQYGWGRTIHLSVHISVIMMNWRTKRMCRRQFRNILQSEKLSGTQLMC